MGSSDQGHEHEPRIVRIAFSGPTQDQHTQKLEASTQQSVLTSAAGNSDE